MELQNNLLERIRSILRKTVLPLRKKKEEWLSNFRLSIMFRISISYIKLMLVYGMFFLIGIFLIFIIDKKKDFDQMANEIMVSLTENNHHFNPYYMQGLTMQIIERSSGEEIYNDISFIPSRQLAFFHEIHFDSKNIKNILIIDEFRNYTSQDQEYQVKFQYDMTLIYQDIVAILWKVGILYVIMVFLILRKGKKSDQKLFEPLRIMSATANRLTVSNLDSERLSVEGTKNELKDLANVINEMLDRLETSYVSQKQFVSDASHELRTPIAVIQGYANLLDRWGSSNEEVLEESIEAIKNEAKSMQDLVEKLLFLSRHDKKTLKLTKKRFNMRPVVEDMVKETKLLASNRVVMSPVLDDVVVYGDKQSLKQAIRVFIDNAIKYSNDGDEIVIKCEKIDGDCVITVQDTGLGMTRKDLDHIFDRFYRSDNVRDKQIIGHGLGLSLAKLIILAHVGNIKIRSQFKVGTSFIITIPRHNR